MSIRVHEYEGDLWVAGTESVDEANEILQTWHNPDAEWNGWLCQEHQSWTCECPTDADRDPKAARVYWYRVVPGCPRWCGEGHKTHWHDATPHSRGAFPAVVWWLV